MKTALVNISFLLLFCYLGASILLYVFQRNFLYFPTEKYAHPYESMSVSSEGETLEIIVLNKGNTKALIYFGGNGEAVVANAEAFALNFSDVTTYLVNYRGYGGSSGKPTESGIYKDALEVYDQVQETHSYISVAGRSLGSGVATYLAANRPVKGVALITPYDSILNVARNRFSMFPVKFLLKDHYDSLSRAKEIKSNTLVIVAEHDQVIPMRHTQRLIDGFRQDQVLLKVIKNSGHNNLSNSAVYYELLKNFI